MSVALTSAREWRVSARARGEVITAGARAGGCQFLVLGVPGGTSIPEIESWLRDLLVVAAESSRNDLNPRPIPSLLHHALTGLLFSHREVWNAVSALSPVSLAFVHTEAEVGFGWVGTIEPQVWVDGRPVEAQWVRVRDHEGREARAFGIEAGPAVRVSLEWTPEPGTPGAASVEVDAECGGAQTPAAREEAPEPPAAAAAPAALAPEDGPRKRAAAFGAWMARVRADEEPEAKGGAPGVLEEGEQAAMEAFSGEIEGSGAPAPGPGPPAVQAPPTGAVASARVPARGGEGPLPVPPRSAAGGEHVESQGVSSAASPPARSPAGAQPSPRVRSEPTLPELIPPTPESSDLSARALRPQAESRAPSVARRRLEIGEELEPAAAPRRPRMRPDWPSERELERARPRRAHPWMWLLGLVVLLAGAWLAGLIPAAPRWRDRGLTLLGLGGARFQVSVDSRPPGAWIAADGKDLARRTPASLELPAGEHQIALSFPDLGSAAFTVRGARGDRQTLTGALWGSLAIRGADANVPIAVDLDGDRVGFAPITIDSVSPGAHEVRFSGPGLTPWGQALRVRVGEVTEMIARPMSTPANGILEVRATFTDDSGTNALTGAMVWVDGALRGVTPLVLELPRGPHSVRVGYRGEEAPIEVIDLPGGNQRFASFELGVGSDNSSLAPGHVPPLTPLDRPTVMSASLDGVTSAEVREMWLHVREPDGSWRRYEMMMLRAPAGVVGVAVFPTALFDARGVTRYYMSAATQTGDEYFTEILTARAASAPVPVTEH